MAKSIRTLFYQFLRDFPDGDLLHYITNYCLVKGGVRQAMLLQEEGFPTRKLMEQVIRWFRREGPELHITPHAYQTLITRHSLQPEDIEDNDEWFGEILGYDCAGEMEGSYAVSIVGIYRDQDFEFIVQRCNNLSKLPRIYNLVRRIRSFFRKYHVPIDVVEQHQKFYLESEFLPALQRCEVPPEMFPDLANYFINWGFNRITTYLDLLHTNKVPISPKFCSLFFSVVQWIDKHQYNIGDFRTKREFLTHEKNYHTQVDMIEHQIFDVH